MHPNATLIESFYRGFKARDYQAMGACYQPDVTFSDPVFHELHGPEARAMWHMLLTRGSDLTLTFKNIQADDQHGSAAWDAYYTFSTGRRVHNAIQARFVFRDGRIIRHQDSFDLWRWAAQALGLQGQLLGWLPPVQATIHRTARKQLDQFLLSHASEYGAAQSTG